uniref:Uncharacterized protein n=1 Tax=Marseillevirus sp. TaxID=2809551 RepID=A0AA96EN89_9VIRU|nr:hypothetical protein MarFTMF_113 [Marseillevirus sp.]
MYKSVCKMSIKEKLVFHNLLLFDATVSRGKFHSHLERNKISSLGKRRG